MREPVDVVAECSQLVQLNWATTYGSLQTRTDTVWHEGSAMIGRQHVEGTPHSEPLGVADLSLRSAHVRVVRALQLPPLQPSLTGSNGIEGREWKRSSSLDPATQCVAHFAPATRTACLQALQALQALPSCRTDER